MPRPFLLLLGLLLARPTLGGARHAYHSTITELRLNAPAKQVELSVKVFADDLEKAISQGQPKAVSLREPRALPLVAQYLHQHLLLSLPAAARTGRQPLDVQLVGLQPDQDAYWVYAKAPLPHPTTELLVHQAMLLEQFPDQMNIVNAEGNGKKTASYSATATRSRYLVFSD